MQNRQLFFSPRKPYDLVADLPCRQAGRSEAASNSLRFSKMWFIFEIVGTVSDRPTIPLLYPHFL